MNKTVITEELSIVVVARNHNPTILNPDFLKYNEIVPLDWELAGPPVCVDLMAQVTYANSVKIVSQFDKVIFTETLAEKETKDVSIPKIAKRYIETLPHVEYRAVGINLKGHVIFQDEAAIQKFIVETLLAPGPWQQFGEAKPKAGIKLVYVIRGCQLSLTVEENKLQLPDKILPVALFSANFHRDLTGENKKQRLDHLFKSIDNWENDLKTFKELVNEKFLKSLE